MEKGSRKDAGTKWIFAFLRAVPPSLSQLTTTLRQGNKKKSTLATPRGPSPALSLLLPALSSAKGQCLTHLEGREKLARRPVQQRFPLLDWKRGDGGGGASKNEEKASLLTNEDARDRAQHFPLRYPPPSLHVRIRDAQCAT